MSNEVRFIATRSRTVQLRQGRDGLWEDEYGTVFAMREKGTSFDPIDQCGISPLAIPVWATPPTVLAACRAHDYMYESPAYQVFYTRAEADAQLAMMLGYEPSLWRLVGKPFRWLASTFGGRAWENEKTR